MDLILIGQVVTAFLSAFAAALAWAAKLQWSREYAAAKDETIKAKEAQIEILRTQLQELKELTPMRLREYFVSTKQQLEEYTDSLKQRIKELENSIAEEKSKAASPETIKKLQDERDELRQRISAREEQLKEFVELLGMIQKQLFVSSGEQEIRYNWRRYPTFSYEPPLDKSQRKKSS